MSKVYISFSAEINPMTTENLIAILMQQVNNHVECVHLLLSTPGGSVMNGLNLYNIMRGLPLKIITHNVGNVDSIGNAIFLAGEERLACPHSTFMFHGVGMDVSQPIRMDEARTREMLNNILSDQTRIGNIIAERSNIDAGESAKMFTEASTKNADFALSKGLVHRIENVNIPPGSPVISLVFQR